MKKTLTTNNLASEVVLVLGMLTFVFVFSVKDAWVCTKTCTFALLTMKESLTEYSRVS